MSTIRDAHIDEQADALTEQFARLAAHPNATKADIYGAVADSFKTVAERFGLESSIALQIEITTRLLAKLAEARSK